MNVGVGTNLFGGFFDMKNKKTKTKAKKKKQMQV